MTPPPNFFRFVRVDESTATSWALLTITGASTSTETGNAYAGAIMEIVDNKVVFWDTTEDQYGDEDGGQRIEFWQADTTDSHGIALKGDLSGSEMESGIIYKSYANNDPKRRIIHNATYNIANDRFLIAGGNSNNDLEYLDSTVLHAGVVTPDGNGEYNNFTAIGEITASFTNPILESRNIIGCNNEWISFFEDGDQGYAYGQMHILHHDGTNEQTINFDNLELTRSGDTVAFSSTSAFDEYHQLGAGGSCADKSQNYVAIACQYADTNGKKGQKKGVIVFASASSGYYHCAQLTSSQWSDGSTPGSGDNLGYEDNNLKRWHTRPGQIAFNDDYFVMGLPGADFGTFQDGTTTRNNMGAIEIHKRTSADWATSEIVLSMSGSEVLAAASLDDSYVDDYGGQSDRGGGAYVGSTVDIAPNGDFIVSAPGYRSYQGNTYQGVAIIFTKDSSTDTWTYATHLTGSTDSTVVENQDGGTNNVLKFKDLSISNTEALVAYTVPNSQKPDRSSVTSGPVTTIATFRKS